MGSQTPDIRIICVDEGRELRRRLGELFPGRETVVQGEVSIDRVLERFESEVYDVLIITGRAVRAGSIDGFGLLEVIAAKSPSTQVLFLVEPRDIRLAM